jgi:hypothetical protein
MQRRRSALRRTRRIATLRALSRRSCEPAGALNVVGCRAQDREPWRPNAGYENDSTAATTGSYPKHALGGAEDGRIFYHPWPSKMEKSANLPVGLMNDHPCVKPVMLLRWLSRFTCPLGGRILDPFCDSGSGGVAAVLEGRSCVGFEPDSHDVEIARARVLGAKS